MEKMYKNLKEYMESKYGMDYLSAISKLSVTNPYDGKGILKPEYVLTYKEKDALMYYLPETKQYLTEDGIFELAYQEFLMDVKSNTEKVVSNSKPIGGDVISWKVVGIEFLDWKVKEEYGMEVYKRACEEVPYEDDGVHRMFHRDFSKANVKLGHIIHEGVSASPLMDLDYFMKLLSMYGIPSYIDYESNTFYYGGVPEQVDYCPKRNLKE